MRPHSSIHNPWRVSHLLKWQEIALCKMYGMDANSLIALALEELMFHLLKRWGSLETYSVAFDLRRDKTWQKIAHECDDFKEFKWEALQAGIRETSGGISLKDRKISSIRISTLIRSMRRGKKDENRESFLLPDQLRKKRSHKSNSAADEGLGDT